MRKIQKKSPLRHPAVARVAAFAAAAAITACSVTPPLQSAMASEPAGMDDGSMDEGIWDGQQEDVQQDFSKEDIEALEELGSMLEDIQYDVSESSSDDQQWQNDEPESQSQQHEQDDRNYQGWQQEQAPAPIPEAVQQPERPMEPTPTPTPTPEPESPAPVHRLSATCSTMSFGTVTAGGNPQPQSFSVTNEGNEPAMLSWRQAGAADVFRIEVGSDAARAIQPGQSISCTVYPLQDRLAPGDYSSAVTFMDSSDGSSSVQIGLSVRVEDDRPKISKVEVEPRSAEMCAGSTLRFTANVAGTGKPDLSVKWEVQGASSRNTYIDGSGYLSIGSNESSRKLTVAAISNQDNGVRGTAQVSIPQQSYSVSAWAEPFRERLCDRHGGFQAGAEDNAHRRA